MRDGSWMEDAVVKLILFRFASKVFLYNLRIYLSVQNKSL